MKIAMIASEANPLYHTGGLAEVVYSLSRSLNSLGHETIVIVPFYKYLKNYKESIKPEFVGSFNVFMSWRNQYTGVFKLVYNGITFYLIDNEQYFMRDEIYGFNDDNERYAFFSIAALESLRLINFHADIIHVHDWQTSIIPCLLKEKYNRDPFFKGVKSALTIHNPAFKGFMDKYFLNNYFGLSDSLYDMGKVRFDGLVSTLKAGIVYSDVISTVSPNHRNELLDPLSSFKFNYVLELRRDDFVGIVNGIDYDEYNPEKDEIIAKTYSHTTFAKAKEACKADLLKSFPIKENKGPVFGLVTRLSEQKGLDLLLANIPYLMNEGASLVIVGSGEKDIQNKLQALRDQYPDRIGVYFGYNTNLAHKIFAGSDFFLMPSQFEPCGIGQLISERYGTLPVARETGGLKDTIISFDGSNATSATGFLFTNFNADELHAALEKALSLYHDKTTMNKLIKNAMNRDSSWAKSAQEYIKLYEKALLKL